MCAEAGDACEADADCCRGSCAAGTCAATCVREGGACAADDDCCDGACTDGACGPAGGECRLVGESCGAGVPCCSGNCLAGLCAEESDCRLEGEPCTDSVECCGGGVCTDGACEPARACVRCSEAIMGGDPLSLCEESQPLFDAFLECACVATCFEACELNVCQGMDPTDECVACVMDTAAGCGNQFQVCANDF